MSDELMREFTQRRGQYLAFTSSIKNLLEKLIEQKDVPIFSVEYRTKEIDSFADKISRDDKIEQYKRIEDVTDLSGIRIVTYLQEDCVSKRALGICR